MITREYVENYLRVNEIPNTFTDEVIYGELQNAGWNETDIKTALSIVRGTFEKNEPNSSPAMLYTDKMLSPTSVLSLTNIHVTTHKHYAGDTHRDDEKTTFTDVLHTLAALVLAVLVAGVTSTIAMYIFKIGPFYT